MPEEETALRLALDLTRHLTCSPQPPLAEALATLVRLSARIADRIAGEIAGAGVTEVQLHGAGPAQPRKARVDQPLPLCDWRALACPVAADEVLTLRGGQPGNPETLAAATRAHRPGAYDALQANGLIVLPAESLPHTRLRALKFAASDPVSFALLSGARVAAFPEVPGWSAKDTARRAVAEHRACLRTGKGAPDVIERPIDERGTLGMLFTAARAALFLESVSAEEPRLFLTVAQTAAGLSERTPRDEGTVAEAVAAWADPMTGGRSSLAPTIAALRPLEGLQLPGYASAASERGAASTSSIG